MPEVVSLIKFKEPNKPLVKRGNVTCLINASKRPKPNHKTASMIHFKKRFYERVGVTLSDAEYIRFKNHVKNTGRFCHRRENETGAIYTVLFRGRILKVVFDSLTDRLITILT